MKYLIFIANILKTALGGENPPHSEEGERLNGVENEIGAWLTMGLLIRVISEKKGLLYTGLQNIQVPQ